MRMCANLPKSMEIVLPKSIENVKSEPLASSDRLHYDVFLAAMNMLVLVLAMVFVARVEACLRPLVEAQLRVDRIAKQDRFTQTAEEHAGGVTVVRAGVLEEMQQDDKGEVHEVVDAAGEKRKKDEAAGDRQLRDLASLGGWGLVHRRAPAGRPLEAQQVVKKKTRAVQMSTNRRLRHLSPPGGTKRLRQRIE